MAKRSIKTHKICVIMPAYNEALVIGEVITSLKHVLSQKYHEHEIVVINDRSSDDTSGVASRSGAVVINHLLNSGAGGATSTGLRYAQRNNFDIAVTLDSDGQHLAADVMRGIEEMTRGDADLLIGSRLIDNTGMSTLKVVGNRGLGFITLLLFGVYTTDSQSGLRLFSKKALDKLRWNASGYEFCSEMLWRAKKLGLRIREYPITAVYTDYSIAKGQNNWNGVNIVLSLIGQRVREVLG